MTARTDVETVVVGAGHAGLAASWALGELGREHVVLEEGCIGATWRDDRWDSFRLNTPRWMSRLPGDPPRPDARDGFDTATEFADALAAYARARRLPVREHAGRVTVADADDGILTVHAAGGPLTARNVIVATGFQKIPVRPAIASALPERLLQLDTTTYRSPAALPEGAVLVAGGGQSGCQIAEDLAEAGRRVVLATSMVGRVPRRHRGRDALAWWTESGFYEVRRRDVDEAVTRVRQPLLSGTRGGHTLSLQSLAEQGVVLAGRLVDADGEEVRFDGGAEEHVRHGDRVSADLVRSIDEHIDRAGIDAPPASPDPDGEPRPGLGAAAPRTLHLDRAGIRTVVWCAGMLPRAEVLDALGPGALAHTDGVSPVPGLYFMGAPWLSTRKSGIIWGAVADAERIARLVSAGRTPRASAASPGS